MSIDTIVSVFKLINKLPSCAKTVIIVGLFGLLAVNYIKTQNETILRQYNAFMEMKEQKAEQYTLETASDINRYIGSIAEKDTSAYNVLLLNYHNTQTSLQGYRYLYLNCLTEKPKGLETEPLREFWTNLEYIYYEDELRKIHSNEYLRIPDIEMIRASMPKFYKRLKLSGAKSAAFYTIEGTRSPIGLIVILYKDTKEYPQDYYMKVLSLEVQKLAVLLDYKTANKCNEY